jgi:peroxiredoxin
MADPYATIQGGTAVITAPPGANEPVISPAEVPGSTPHPAEAVAGGGVDKVSMILSVVGLLIVIGMVVVLALMKVE